MQTYTRGYLKVMSSKDYDVETFSSLLKPFSDLPLIIEDCKFNLDGIEFDVCVPGFDLSRFMSALNLHYNEVIGMFTQALAYRSLSHSPIKESLISEITQMVKETNPIDLNELGCNKIEPGVNIKTETVNGIPFIKYHTQNLTIVVPAQVNVNLSCFVKEASEKLEGSFIRFVVDPLPSIYFNAHSIMTIKHDIKDIEFYAKVITFIKYLVNNKELLQKVSTIAKQIREIEDREIYFEFKLKALIEEIEKKLIEIYRSVYDSKTTTIWLFFSNSISC